MSDCRHATNRSSAVALFVIGLAMWVSAASGWQPAAQPPPTKDERPVNPLRPEVGKGQLPWEEQDRRSIPLPRPPAGPREFLSRYGIGDSQWDGFQDGQPLSAAEEETLVRLLNLYPRFGQENVEQWAHPEEEWEKLSTSANSLRGEIVHLAGRVQRVGRRDLIPEVKARYDFDHYFVLDIVRDGAAGRASVYCTAVPSAWKLDASLDERVSVYGLFLKTGEVEAGSAPLLLVTFRPAWRPVQPRPELGVDEAQVALASLGIDIGRFQEVGIEKGTGLLAVDREPFYQILAALGDPSADLLRKTASPALDLPQLLAKPQPLKGHMLTFQGLARRVARIEVDDTDIRRRFAIDHYFEIDLSLPLKQTIRLAPEAGTDAMPVTYEHSFPATVCVRELPEGLTIGDDLRQPIDAQGLFFKIWNYPSGYTRDANLTQPAPLFLARSVRLTPKEATSYAADWILGGVMIIVLLGFVAIVVWFRWSDRRGSPLRPEMSQQSPNFDNLK